MEDKVENPKAFPSCEANEHTDPRNGLSGGGMTLRDYFAAKAIGIVFREHGHKAFNNTEEGFNNYALKFSKQAYQIADAMLKERLK